jgi:hypothetical protein
LFGQFTSSRALRISITDRLGGYRFRLILKNGPKPLREISCERERGAIAEEFSRRAHKFLVAPLIALQKLIVKRIFFCITKESDTCVNI